ncbi:MAG: 2-amino-4-hydroxy-6-hydroxymethyldihydropteridine diphosphokinase, partial [Candidatus Eremiobacteraeota bacterium]|nr:2-amino-4-hydroxy-6-hydroxymethyldihydropteridine diphosphokinase [Candidatus Eremiobacteraeota bacterium]
MPATLGRAVAALSALGSVVAVSSLYRSRPWGRREQADFWNAVALLSTPLEAPVLLARLKEIELRLGRTPSVRWGVRAIDLDILTFGNVRLATPDLEIPHPRLLERAFALAPLAEVDARFRESFEALTAAERESVTLAGPFQPVGETQPLMP